MKKYISYLLLCFSMILCWQCEDFIDVRPENSPTYTNYFRSKQDAEALLTGLQTRVKAMAAEGYWLDSWGILVDEDPYSSIPNQLNPMYGARPWDKCYQVIYQADLILDNAHRFEISEEEIRPYVLQANFAKSLAYFWLVRNFGEVPITQGSTKFNKLPQSPIGKVLDEAEKYGLRALDLPVYEEMVEQSAPAARMKQYGSKGAAVALMAHICAWRAGVEGKSEYWEKAEEYCRMIIDGEAGNYRLADTPEEVCTNVMRRDSDESILEIYFNSFDNSLRKIQLVGFPLDASNWALPGNNSKPYISKATVRRMYPEGDLRRDAYFWATDADKVYLNHSAEGAVASMVPGDSVIKVIDNSAIEQAYLWKFRYPYYKKYDYDPQPSFQGIDQNQVVWRLADIYLLRAECRARQGKSNAAEDLNKIRGRAYGDLNRNALTAQYAFPCADDVKNGLAGNIALAIYREREKELLSENHRWYDIVRNGWCHLRGEDPYDYIREEISEAYAKLTDQDIYDGAMYFMLGGTCFSDNDLIRQNVYWNRVTQ